MTTTQLDTETLLLYMTNTTSNSTKSTRTEQKRLLRDSQWSQYSRDIRRGRYAWKDCLCYMCYREGRYQQGTEVDHLSHEEAMKDFMAYDNTGSICKKHHSRVSTKETCYVNEGQTREERQDHKTRFYWQEFQEIGQDGYPIHHEL